MIFLVLAILSSTTVSISLRFSNTQRHSLYGKFFCNYIVCVFLSLFFVQTMYYEKITLTLGLLNGFLLISGLFLMQLSMKLNGVALTSLYGRLGVFVPLMFSMLVFNEMPTWLQLFGMFLSFISMCLFFYQSKINFKLGFILLLFMLISGLGDTMNKIYQFYGEVDLASEYFFISFLAAAIFSFILMLVKKQNITRKEWLYGFMIGIPNYFSSYFLLMSLNHLPSIVVYPTYSMATIVTISLCGYFFFKEIINKEMIMTFVLIMISIGLLNI